MQTLLAWLKLFPALLASVKALEEAIPLPAAGKGKLDLLLIIVKTAYDAEEAIRKEFPWERLASIVISAAKAIVEALNALGVFHRSAEVKP